MESLEKKRAIRNIGFLTVSKVLVYLLSIVTITLIPRYLGVEGYGQLNFVLSFIGIFAIFGDLGVNALLFRDVSKNIKLKNKYFNNLFLPRVSLLFIVGVLMVLVSFFLDKPLVVKQMIFFGLFFIVFTYSSNFLFNNLSALQKFKYQAYNDFLFKLFYVIFVLLVIYFNMGLLGVFLSQVMSALLVFLFLLFSARKYFNFKLKFNTSFFIKKLKYSWPFALAIVFTTIFFNFDRLFISLYKGDFQLGLYAIGVSFVGFLIAITSIISIVFFNLLSKYSNKKESKLILNKFLKIMMAFSFPVFFGGLLLSKDIILLLFGKSYLLGATSFSILLLFFLFISLSIALSRFLYSHNFEKFVLKVRGISTAVNIILNVIFIPIFGIVGAAVTTVVSEIINFIFYFKKTKSKINFSFFNNFYKILTSSLIMLFFIYVFKNIYKIKIFYNSFDVFVIIGVCGAIYLFFLYLFRIITVKEVKEIIFSLKK